MMKLRNDTFQRFSALMHDTIGLSLPDGKLSLVATRLSGRIQRLGLDSYEEYLALIMRRDDGGEFQMAIDLLTTNETYFFRESLHFDLIAQEVMAKRPKRLRVWSAASSFGDEAFSTAMLLADLQRCGQLGDDWQILGTDISDRVLQSAAQAVYPQERLREVSPERLRRYVLRGEGASLGLAQMHPTLREHVRFGQVNLCRPIENLGPFDVIFLRNVLIYFDAPTKQEVVERVLAQLRPGGLFFIGAAEGRVSCSTALQNVGHGAFRKSEAWEEALA